MAKALRPLGLYIHIPFCKSKCSYCDFYSLPQKEEQMDAYVHALLRHLEESALPLQGHEADTVYFGGGTPSHLGPARLLKILKHIKKHYHVSPEAEITLEANPDSALDQKVLGQLRKGGFNRISLGVQSADDSLLQKIGRIHSFQQVQEAVAAIRAAGFSNLSLDLIYGLPDQSLAHWQDTLAKTVALAPEHLSCYGLKVEPGTPLYARQAESLLPGDEEQADMYLYTVDYLARQGYRQYEISNFAREGYGSRHNQKYWQLEEYAGFGPGAHSDLGGVRYAYIRDLGGYIRGVEQGGELLSEREEIPAPYRDTEYLMLGLRTTRGICQAEFRRRFGRGFEALLPVLEQCRQSGYALEEKGRWHLTAEGFLLSNRIIGLLWEALDKYKRTGGSPSGRGRSPL